MPQIEQAIEMLQDNKQRREEQMGVLRGTGPYKPNQIIGFLRSVPEREVRPEEYDLLNKQGYFCDGATLYCAEKRDQLTETDVRNIVYEVCLSRLNYTQGVSLIEHQKIVRYMIESVNTTGLFASDVQNHNKGLYNPYKALYTQEEIEGLNYLEPKLIVARRGHMAKQLQQISKGESIKRKWPCGITQVTQYVEENIWEYPERGMGLYYAEGLQGCYNRLTIYYDRETGCILDMETKDGREKIETHKGQIEMLNKLKEW